MADKPVRVFALSTCYHCKLIRKMLEKYSVPAEYLELDQMEEDERDAALAEMKARGGDRPVFPTLFIGEAVVEGARRDEILEALENQGIMKLSFLERLMAIVAGER